MIVKQVAVPVHGDVATAGRLTVLLVVVELPSVTPVGSVVAVHVYGATPPFIFRVSVSAVLATNGIEQTTVGDGVQIVLPAIVAGPHASC